MSSSMKKRMHSKIVAQFDNVFSLKVQKFSIATKGLSCVINSLLRFTGTGLAYIHTLNIVSELSFLSVVSFKFENT